MNRNTPERIFILSDYNVKRKETIEHRTSI